MQMLFWMSLFGGIGGGNRDRGGGNAFMIMLAVYAGTITVYFLSQVLILALSRYRELAADRASAIVTGCSRDQVLCSPWPTRSSSSLR